MVKALVKESLADCSVDLFAAVYKKKMKAPDLTFAANVALLNLRDAWLAREADRFRALATDEHLIFIQALILKRVEAVDLAYAQTVYAEMNEIELPELLAYSLAVLMWYADPPFALQQVLIEEAAVWLNQLTVQLALF